MRSPVTWYGGKGQLWLLELQPPELAGDGLTSFEIGEGERADSLA